MCCEPASLRGTAVARKRVHGFRLLLESSGPPRGTLSPGVLALPNRPDRPPSRLLRRQPCPVGGARTFLLGCQVATHRPGARRSSGVSGLPSRERLYGRTSPSTRFQPTRSRDGRREGHSPRHENDAALGREWFCCDAQTGMPSAEASGAICVQRFDDSRNSAIHITYRISLRSSSMQEPRYPLLRVVMFLVFCATCARERPPSTQRFSVACASLLSGWWEKLGGPRRTLPSGWGPLTPVEFTTRGSRLARTHRPRRPHSPLGCPPRGFRVRSSGIPRCAPPEALCVQTTNRQRVGRGLRPESLPCLATRRSGVSGHG